MPTFLDNASFLTNNSSLEMDFRRMSASNSILIFKPWSFSISNVPSICFASPFNNRMPMELLVAMSKSVGKPVPLFPRIEQS